MSSRVNPSAKPDRVSYETETISSSSGRSTIISEISSSVVDQPSSKSKVTEVKSNKPGCCLESECHCYCGRDCSENCRCRCMQNTSCCLINFFYYFLLFLRYHNSYLFSSCLIASISPSILAFFSVSRRFQ